MSKALSILAAAGLALALATPQPVAAAEAPPSPRIVPDSTERALREGAETIMKAIELMLNAIPQYEMPEMLPNGDIIIRRKPPEAPAWPDGKPAPAPDRDQTKT